MISWGYTLSSEEFDPLALVAQAQRAEAEGFEFLTVSDHFHPWVSQQGQSPFVWSTVGGVAATTSNVRLGTGVTCPIMRIHPALVAQAAATSQVMMNGRFFLGVGTGEALNEHIIGEHWPAVEVRRDMLVEAVEVMRALWTGETVDYWGEYFTVENARLFTVPEQTVPIIVAAAGTDTAELAAEIGDGMWSTSPSNDVVKAYRDAGGEGPIYGQITLCWAEDEAEARQTALRVWPNAGIPGQLSQDLPTWTHFEQVAKLVTEDTIAEQIACGPDPARVLASIDAYREAGFDHLHVHQVGPDQGGFFDFWARQVMPRLSS
jgi:coenzyme F420-dependent glucose-6-phosphate dehydrogenase